MTKKFIFIIASILICSINSYSQSIQLNKSKLESTGVSMSLEKMMGKNVVKVIKDSSVKGADAPTFVKIKDVHFKNGTIECKVLSRLEKTAPEFARGFIGIAFRIDSNNKKFESIYLRPTNGRANDQVRRNHSIQYFSYPDYTFDRLRKDSPEKYESYSDMGLNEWISMKIEVKGDKAKLFLNGRDQPVLIVNDLKHGVDASGTIGLWVDIGTEGYFADIKVTHDK